MNPSVQCVKCVTLSATINRDFSHKTFSFDRTLMWLRVDDKKIGTIRTVTVQCPLVNVHDFHGSEMTNEQIKVVSQLHVLRSFHFFFSS